MNDAKGLWVVYLKLLHGKQTPMTVVCEQSEWDTMELANPGQYTLLMSEIASEGEAERIARERAVVNPATRVTLPTR
jgi:hypothetical protein